MRHPADAISAADLFDATDSDVAPQQETTHYLPAFIPAPVFRGRLPRRQQAVCGLPIDASEHSTEPTCQACQDWLVQEAEDTAETAEALGMEIRDGFLVYKDAR